MEDQHLKNTLDMLKDYDLSTIERTILASTDTVQSLLSVIFGVPARVEVISQLNYDTVLVRWVKLVIEDPDLITVALAESVIPIETNHASFIGAMGDRDVGIGRAIANLKTYTERMILGVHVDDATFSRTYTINGAAIDVLITESFNRELYRGLK